MEHIIYDKRKENSIISLVINTLKLGGLVVYPSDTVYGLLVDATHKQAVKKLIEFKNRPLGKAISIFVLDLRMIKKVVEVSDDQEKTINQLLPGPFTVILKSKHQVCKELESEKETLGVRIPQNNSINRLIKLFGKPLTATSANLSGRSPHYSIESLLKELPNNKKKLIDLIIDVGKLPRNKPSTVVDLSQSEFKIIRQGDLNLAKKLSFISSSDDETKKIAQFILKKNLDFGKVGPLFFVIQGELGVGKTIFVKGLGESLGINNIISPSYVIYYEYSKLIHVDLYNVGEKEEFNYLGLDKYFVRNQIICFEWGEKLGDLYKTLESKGKVVCVEMRYLDEKKREIIINKLT